MRRTPEREVPGPAGDAQHCAALCLHGHVPAEDLSVVLEMLLLVMA